MLFWLYDVLIFLFLQFSDHQKLKALFLLTVKLYNVKFFFLFLFYFKSVSPLPSHIYSFFLAFVSLQYDEGRRAGCSLALYLHKRGKK